MEPSVKETNGEDAEKGGSENSKDLDFPLKKTLDADDPMLGFLTLLAKVERPACANCESKDVSPMFYCNTCGKFVVPYFQLLSSQLGFVLFCIRYCV